MEQLLIEMEKLNVMIEKKEAYYKLEEQSRIVDRCILKILPEYFSKKKEESKKNKYKDEEQDDSEENLAKRLVGTAKLIEMYKPLFNSRNITLAINTQNLPYMQLGRKRYFELAKIEKWIEEQEMLKEKSKCISKFGIRYKVNIKQLFDSYNTVTQVETMEI